MAKLKTYEERIKSDKGKEESLGIPREGFYDPGAEFPKREYKDGSSLNKAATGIAFNETSVGGADDGINFDIPSVRQSIYPRNNIQETAGGHIIEIDDTVGNERVMIKHRSGAGIEARADGSVIVTSIKNKIEVTGGNQAVLVEGNGDVVYKGDLNLSVHGNFNLDVKGDYNVTVDGDKSETIKHDCTTTIIQDESTIIKGSRSTQIEDNETKTVRGTVDIDVQGDVDYKFGDDYNLTVKNTHSINAYTVDYNYDNGNIGGTDVDFTGSTSTCITFHGDLTGRADEAIASDTAIYASYGGGPGGPAGWSNTNEARVFSPLLDSDEARTVTLATLDVNLKPNTTLPYVNYTPTTSEARSMLRSSALRSDTAFTKGLILANVIYPTFSNAGGYSTTGRSTTAATSARRGETPIGSNPPTFDFKSFTF